MRIAIAHACMVFGGAESKAVWGIEALKGEHEVSLLTAGPVDWDALNSFYGTAIRADQVSVRRPGRLLRSFGRGDVLRCGLFQRYCRSVSDEFDVLISVCNPLDFGVPAIHYVTDFSWRREIWSDLYPDAPPAQRLIHRDGLLRDAYLALGRRLARPSGRDILGGDDLLVANSKFTAGILRERLALSDVPVVYPPVIAEARGLAFDERETGFVCLGRISAEKRIERVIEILTRVRHLGHDVHLHVLGRIQETPYGRFIRRLCEENCDWVFSEGERTGAAKLEILARHRFALHACPGETFGIAVAEMAKAGCVVFVPAYGGPAEIVGDERLCYQDVDDAVRKIDRVVRDTTLQRQFAMDLQRVGRRFSSGRYMVEFRAVLAQFVAGRQQPSAQPEHSLRGEAFA